MVQITILGNLTADAIVRETQGEYKAISFSVATNEKRKDKEDASAFFNCTLWSKSDKIAQYLTKGKKVLVQIDWMETTEKDGKYYTNFRVRNVNPFLENKAQSDHTAKPYNETPKTTKKKDDVFAEEEDDLPF